MIKMEREKFEKLILEKIDVITKLLAANVLCNKKFNEQVKLLDEFGLGQKDIAMITGRTAKNVSVRLAEIRRKLKGGEKHVKKADEGKD